MGCAVRPVNGRARPRVVRRTAAIARAIETHMENTRMKRIALTLAAFAVLGLATPVLAEEKAAPPPAPAAAPMPADKAGEKMEKAAKPEKSKAQHAKHHDKKKAPAKHEEPKAAAAKHEGMKHEMGHEAKAEGHEGHHHEAKAEGGEAMKPAAPAKP